MKEVVKVTEQKEKQFELTLDTGGNITDDGKKFLECHNDILFCFRNTYEFALKTAENLKRMRDDKLYLAAGFDKFEAYTFAALGLKERQAYNYIKILESYSTEFLHSNAKLGVTKLLLMAPLTEDERGTLTETAETSTVEDLKNQIIELKQVNGEQLTLFNKEKKRITVEAEQKNKKQIEALTKRHDNLILDNERLMKRIKDIENSPGEIITVPDKEAELRVKQLEDRINEQLQKNKTLEKQLAIAKDANVTKFAVKIEDLQKVVSELKGLLNMISGESHEKCKNAMVSLLGGLIK